MFIDISLQENSANLILHLEKRERYLPIQDNCPEYNLCHVKSGDKHYVPYIALPLLIDIAKKINYPVQFSDKLKAYHSKQMELRKTLELLKGGEDPKNYPELASIKSMVESLERSRGFTLMEGQKRSIPYCIFGEKVLIANEIGTGKSLLIVIVAKYLLSVGKIKKILILVPAPLVRNFQDDYIKFFGKQGLMVISNEVKEKRKVLYNQFMQSNCQFLITNYEKCLYDIEYLNKCMFEMVVVDEFHRMRNFLSAKRSINFFDTVENNWKPKYRFPMSGSPIENQLFDLFPIFRLMDGGVVLGNMRFFENNFLKKEEVCFKINYQGKQMLRREVKTVGFKHIEWVKKLIKPRIIREKLKLNVEYFHEFVFMDMTKEMKTQYNQIRKSEESPSKRYHSLRQFLCDTERGGIPDNPKLEMLEDIIEQTSEKIVVFSFYLCSMDILSKFLTSKGIKFFEISGRTTEAATETIRKFAKDPSAKVLICTDKVNFGCNVQCARFCINFDIPIKPTTSDQRKGRLYRTGQTQNVYGKTFIYRESVEELIYEAFLRKQEVITAAIENLNGELIAKLEGDIEKEILAKI